MAITELVAPVAMRLAVTDPTLDPCVYELSEEQGLAWLGTGDLDVLISVRLGPGDPERPAGIVERDLVPDPYRVIVPASWPVLTDAAELLARRWVTTSYDILCRRVLLELCERYGVTLNARDIGTGSAATLLALVANGLGAAIIPALTLSQNPTPNVRLSRGVIDLGGRIISVLLPANRASAAADRFVAELRRYAASSRAEENPLG